MTFTGETAMLRLPFYLLFTKLSALTSNIEKQLNFNKETLRI